MNDKILQFLDYLEKKHDNTKNDIYDARVLRQQHNTEKSHLLKLLNSYKETLKETEKQVKNLIYSVKNENLKYRSFYHYNQENNIELNLLCSYDLLTEKIKFRDNGKQYTRKLKYLDTIAIGFIYHGNLYKCVNYK